MVKIMDARGKDVNYSFEGLVIWNNSNFKCIKIKTSQHTQERDQNEDEILANS